MAPRSISSGPRSPPPTAGGTRRGGGGRGLRGTAARGPRAWTGRFGRGPCRTVIRRAAATWAFVSRPPHSAFNSPGRCSSFRLNVKVSIEGGPFHGAVRGGHFHVAAAHSGRPVDRPRSLSYRSRQRHA